MSIQAKNVFRECAGNIKNVEHPQWSLTFETASFVVSWPGTVVEARNDFVRVVDDDLKYSDVGFGELDG